MYAESLSQRTAKVQAGLICSHPSKVVAHNMMLSLCKHHYPKKLCYSMIKERNNVSYPLLIPTMSSCWTMCTLRSGPTLTQQTSKSGYNLLHVVACAPTRYSLATERLSVYALQGVIMFVSCRHNTNCCI